VCNDGDVSDIVAHKLWLLYINSLIWKLKKSQYLLDKLILTKNSFLVIVLKTYRYRSKISSYKESLSIFSNSLNGKL